MNWVWVLSFTVLGTSQHGEIAKYASKEECGRALELKTVEMAKSGRTIVGRCALRQEAGRGWW